MRAYQACRRFDIIIKELHVLFIKNNRREKCVKVHREEKGFHPFQVAGRY